MLISFCHGASVPLINVSFVEPLFIFRKATVNLAGLKTSHGRQLLELVILILLNSILEQFMIKLCVDMTLMNSYNKNIYKLIGNCFIIKIFRYCS